MLFEEFKGMVPPFVNFVHGVHGPPFLCTLILTL